MVLLASLCDAGLDVSLETSGAISIAGVDPRVRVVMDVKTPGSGEVEKNLLDNFSLLKPSDEIKFVICNRGDYEFALELVRKEGLASKHQILFSPSHDELAGRDLAEWIIQDGARVRLQLQMHKFIWGNEPGR